MNKSIPVLAPAELKKLFERNESFTLLDVREQEELDIASIPDAIHIPMGQVPERLEELDPSALIVVMCHGGKRSARVCEYLAQLGYEAVNLQGGIDAWSKQVDPLVPVY